jgi:malonyl-CoA O-methyltransferase
VNGSAGKTGALRRRDVQRRFDRAAAAFDDGDFIHRRAASGLYDRMSPMLVDVHTILDAGSATGAATRELAERHRGSRIIRLDHSLNMLRHGRSRRSGFARLFRNPRVSEVQADVTFLPLRTGSIDLVFANMLLPWIDDLATFFTEVGRVLRKDGLFVFSSLGPDSLLELRDAWREVDNDEHVNAFIDMHDVGDALMHSGLREPVLDTDYLTLKYRNAEGLIADLTRAGARNCLARRRPSLTGRESFREMKRALHSAVSDGELPIRLELVFGHAWGGGPRPISGEFSVDARSIGRRSR